VDHLRGLETIAKEMESRSSAGCRAGHSVRAEGEEVVPEGLTTETTVERYLKAQRADVLVTGAFGHSHLREVVLGGVTYALAHAHRGLALALR